MEEIKKMPDIPAYNNKLMVPVCKYDLQEKYIQTYLSLEIAAKENNININDLRLAIIDIIKTCGGYQWRIKR